MNQNQSKMLICHCLVQVPKTPSFISFKEMFWNMLQISLQKVLVRYDITFVFCWFFNQGYGQRSLIHTQNFADPPKFTLYWWRPFGSIASDHDWLKRNLVDANPPQASTTVTTHHGGWQQWGASVVGGNDGWQQMVGPVGG